MKREQDAACITTRIDAVDAEVSRLLNLAWLHMRNDLVQLAQWCDAAVERAADVGAARARFWAHLSRALLLRIYHGLPDTCFNVQDARDDLDTAIALLPEVPEPRAARLVSVCEAYISMVRQDHADALKRLDALPLLGTPERDDPDDFLVLNGRGLCAMGLGRIDETFRAYYAGWLLAERTGPAERLSAAAVNLSGALATIGRVGEALDILEPIVEQGIVPASNLRLSIVARMNLANYRGRSNRVEQACADLLSLLPSLEGMTDGVRFGVLGNLIEFLLVLGRVDEAVRHLETARALAEADGRPSWLGSVLVCTGQLARLQGDLDAAVAAMESARAKFIEDPNMYFVDVLDSRRKLAEWYAEQGRFDLAYERQQEYQVLYARFAEEAARGQNAAAQAKQKAARRYALSDREKECLSWCAAGKTAWETGRILGLSEHTVAYHLDKVKRKFGLATKQQMVARAVGLGLVSAAVQLPVAVN